MYREQAIREIAYRIWESEGKPDNRADEHWRRAEEQIDNEQIALPGRRDPAPTDAQANAPARTKRRAPRKIVPESPAS